MRHSYTSKAVSKEKHYGDMKIRTRQECTKCGCVKETGYFGIIYSRSGMMFDFAPECIDWELENSKTID